MIFWLELKLEISYYRVIICLEGFWFLLKDFFLKIRSIFLAMVKYLSFRNSSFCLKILLTVNGTKKIY
jgi:hypothetical protein